MPTIILKTRQILALEVMYRSVIGLAKTIYLNNEEKSNVFIDSKIDIQSETLRHIFDISRATTAHEILPQEQMPPTLAKTSNIVLCEYLWYWTVCIVYGIWLTLM